MRTAAAVVVTAGLAVPAAGCGGSPKSQVAQLGSSRGHLDIGPGTGIDVNSPRFQAAYQACKSMLSP
jgi:hypothetical protein